MCIDYFIFYGYLQKTMLDMDLQVNNAVCEDTIVG